MIWTLIRQNITCQSVNLLKNRVNVVKINYVINEQIFQI